MLVIVIFTSTLIFYNLEEISGASCAWENDVRLSDDPEESDRPCISIDSQNNVHVVWSHHTSGVGRIYYKKHDGNSWSDIEQLDGGAETAIHPTITSDQSDNIHVAYLDSPVPLKSEIYYTEYDGNSWSSPIFLTLDSGYSISWAPQLGPQIITDSQGFVYIFWTDCTDFDSKDISYVFFDGNVWSTKQRATNDPTPDVDHFNPQIAVDSANNVHLVYTTTEPTGGGYYDYIIHYKKFNGDTWSDQEQIGENYIGYFVGFPTIKIDMEDNIHLLWDDGRDSSAEEPSRTEIYYEKIDNDGNLLINEKRITYTGYSYGSSWPDMEIDTYDNIHVIWDEKLNATNLKVFYKKLDNIGDNITNPFYLTENYKSGGFTIAPPKLAIDPLNRLHLVFGDDRDGNKEVYYKNNYGYDLSVNENDIEFSKELPKNGDHVTINASIHNNGGILTNATVNLYLDSIDIQNLIDSDLVSIPISGTETVSFNWNAITGSHSIWIEIVLEEGITESNTTNNIAFKDITVNDPPTISVINPPSGIITVDTSYSISWIAVDPDNDAQIQLYYDSDNTDHDGILIPTSDQYPSGIVDDNGASQSYEWDTSGLSDGSSYYIYAKIDDGIHEPVYSYSPGKIKIDHQNIAPTIDISSPSGGTHSGVVTIQGTASDDVSVSVVEIRIDNNPWEEASGTTSWSYEWYTTSYTNGEHTITARSKDNTGLYSQEDSVTVTVNNGGNLVPSVDIDSHSMDEVISGIVEIEGISQDNDGFVELVELRIDNGNWQTASGTSSWSFNWDTTSYSNGEHEIYIRAKDNSGDFSEIESITLIVNNGGNIPPKVTIISPSGGTVSGTVTIFGSASDLDGDNTISYVEIKIEGDWEPVNGITEWIYEWDTTELDDGDYTITARAYDGSEFSLEKSVEVKVDNPHEPTLTITSEIPEEATGTVKIQGTASDVDGEVLKIEIQIDDGEWEEIPGTTSWNYELDTTKLSDGEHTIRIRALDDEGEYHEESFTINVNNSSFAIWLIIIIVIILVLVFIIAVGLMRKKSQKTAAQPLASQPAAHATSQSISCPQCRNVFEVPIDSTTVQCPNCGTRGSL
jgi:hypothetical protein